MRPWLGRNWMRSWFQRRLFPRRKSLKKPPRSVARIIQHAPYSCATTALRISVGFLRFPCRAAERPKACPRSEEHTSELQSRLHLVCRLLLEKKKYNIHIDRNKTARIMIAGVRFTNIIINGVASRADFAVW